MDHYHHDAKFAFLYMLSLVGLVFMAIATGSILFEIINQSIVDVNTYYRQGGLKFGISALIVAAPIYYILMWQINKHLRLGNMNKESGVRRWLTYLILFVASVVVIGWLIGLISNFLDGELTLVFALKFLTVLVISAIIFTYYLYDIKKEKFEKDKLTTAYFYGSLILIIAVFVSAFFFVESPIEARNRKHDQNIVNSFNMIDAAVNDYYNRNNELPSSLNVLLEETEHYLTDKDLNNPVSGQTYVYRVTGAETYELCADFKTSSFDEDSQNDYRYMYDKRWRHEKGEYCVEQEVLKTDSPQMAPKVIR